TWPFVAEKSATSYGFWRRWNSGAAGIVADKIAVDQVVRMHPLSRLNVSRCLANDLAILAHVVALANRPHGDLVTQPNRLTQLQRWPSNSRRVTRLQLARGNANVVVRMQVHGIGRLPTGGNGHGAPRRLCFSITRVRLLV